MTLVVCVPYLATQETVEPPDIFEDFNRANDGSLAGDLTSSGHPWINGENLRIVALRGQIVNGLPPSVDTMSIYGDVSLRMTSTSGSNTLSLLTCITGTTAGTDAIYAKVSSTAISIEVGTLGGPTPGVLFTLPLPDEIANSHFVSFLDKIITLRVENDGTISLLINGRVQQSAVLSGAQQAHFFTGTRTKRGIFTNSVVFVDFGIDDFTTATQTTQDNTRSVDTFDRPNSNLEKPASDGGYWVYDEYNYDLTPSLRPSPAGLINVVDNQLRIGNAPSVFAELSRKIPGSPAIYSVEVDTNTYTEVLHLGTAPRPYSRFETGDGYMVIFDGSSSLFIKQMSASWAFDADFVAPAWDASPHRIGLHRNGATISVLFDDVVVYQYVDPDPLPATLWAGMSFYDDVQFFDNFDSGPAAAL